MKAEGLTFSTLHWIYHDCWINRNWSYSYYHGWQVSNTSRRMGHLHFFIPGYTFDLKNPIGQAYSGEQSYNFTFNSIWGPDSGDINQSLDVQYVGSPRWYFEITEYWRRIYIQPWDNEIKNSRVQGVIGKEGIKYDASHKNHTYGPFREGQEFFFYWNKSARTLPIEYYQDVKKRTRDNYLYGGKWYLPIYVNYNNIPNDDTPDEIKEAYDYMTKEFVSARTPFYIPNGDENGGYVDRPMWFRINRSYTRENDVNKAEFDLWQNLADELGATFETEIENGEVKTRIEHCGEGYYTQEQIDEYLVRNPSSKELTETFGCHNVTCSDARYIHPIIEYQTVTHLNDERLPGWAERDRNFGGDGTEITVTLPFKLNDIIQSPFSDDEMRTQPIGTYCHGFAEKFPERILRYPKFDSADKDNFQWYIVTQNRRADGLLISETFADIVYGEKPESGSLPEGQHIAEMEHTITMPATENSESYTAYVKDGKICDEDGDAIFAKRDILESEEYRIPDNLKGKPCVFRIPDGMRQDGVWVEQCLGGIVRARAEVDTIDNFGHEDVMHVSTTKFYLTNEFEGKDQNEPVK